MHINEDRIRHAAKQIAAELLRTRAIDSRMPESSLTRRISQAMRERAERDTELEQQARKLLAKSYKPPAEGTPQHAERLAQLKRELLEGKR